MTRATSASLSIRRWDVIVRVARFVALLLLGCSALFWMAVILSSGPPGGDIERMWLGALRIRAGEPLYTDFGDPQLFYTWAPWLAWIWLPLTYLPKTVVTVLWLALCFVGWAVSLWPARKSLPLLLLFAPLTLFAAWWGNVQPIMTAWLVLSIRRPWGPFGVGLAASLKVSPILLAVPWLATGQLRKAVIASGVAVLFGGPALFSGINHYPFGLAPLLSLRGISIPIWIGVTAGAIGVALVPANTRFRHVASALATIASRPSLLLYDVGYLMVGLQAESERFEGGQARASGHEVTLGR
jgi:hypothetical protein